MDAGTFMRSIFALRHYFLRSPPRALRARASRAGGTGHRGRAPHAAGDRGRQHAPGRHLPAGPAVCGTRPGGRERRGSSRPSACATPSRTTGAGALRAAVPPWRFERPARGPAPRPALRGRRSRRGFPGAVRHGIACAEGERTHRPRATPAGPVPHDGRARRHDGRPPGRPRRPALRAARRAWFPRRGRRGPPRWRGPRARDPRGLRGAAAVASAGPPTCWRPPACSTAPARGHDPRAAVPGAGCSTRTCCAGSTMFPRRRERWRRWRRGWVPTGGRTSPTTPGRRRTASPSP